MSSASRTDTNFYGRFNDVKGTVVFDNADPSKSSVELTIPVESVDTHNEKRDQDLKSPDFFNAKQFPVMTFKSKQVEVERRYLQCHWRPYVARCDQAADSWRLRRVARLKA